uniref:Uncharacterized protein n=1 Tax=Anopheles maculatus TaxID=74869 RepID=A0A182SRU1_9DIPT
MATRLATQRNFITVIPAPTGSSAAATVTIEQPDKGVVVQKTTTEPDDSGSTTNGARPATQEVATVSVASSVPGMVSRPSSSTQLSTIAIAGGLKNGSSKGTLMSANLLANNTNIMNLLGNANGLTLQQIIQQKKIVINTNGTLIDLVPLNDDSESAEIKSDSEKLLDGPAANENVESGNSSEATVDESAQVTAQVAVVQSQSPGDGTPQYITVTGKLFLLLSFVYYADKNVCVIKNNIDTYRVDQIANITRFRGS